MRENAFELLIVSFILGLIWGLGSLTLIIQKFFKQKGIVINQSKPTYYP